MKKTAFLIDVDIFKSKVCVIPRCTEIDEQDIRDCVKQCWKHEDIEEKVKEIVSSSMSCDVAGQAWKFEGLFFIVLQDMSLSSTHLSVLSHEILHIVIWIMKKVGIKMSGKSDEAYCYLQEFLTKQILEEYERTRDYNGGDDSQD